MNKVALSFALSATFAAAVSHALVCDENFHWKSAYQRMLSGKTTATLGLDSTKTLDKTMSGTAILHDDTQYEMFTDFTGAGACDAWKATVIDMAFRAKGDATMKTKHETSHFTKLNPGNYPGDTAVTLDYWFGFTTANNTSPISIYEVIGKSPSESMLHVWYGNATMKRDVFVKDVGTPKYTQTYRFTKLNNHADSAELQKQLISGWTSEVDNDTQHITIKVQLIKVYYDNDTSTAARPAPAVKAAAFQARQVGEMMLLQAGEAKGAPSEPLGLFDMMGRKVAVLHPTGYMYSWNGRTASGEQAPPGVYFAQTGNRILGKFFYSR